MGDSRGNGLISVMALTIEMLKDTESGMSKKANLKKK